MKSLQLVSFALALTLALAPVRPVLAHDGPDGTISHKHNEVRTQPRRASPGTTPRSARRSTRPGA